MTAYRYLNIAATTAAVTNRFVASANMKVGSYTVANASPVWAGGCLVTVTHTTVATGTDTLGTITITGTNLAGQSQTETITPVADNTATGTKIFRTVTSVVGAGWVIAGGNDTIVVGCAAGCYVSGSDGVLGGVFVNTTAAATVVISDSAGTIATLKSSIAEGTYLDIGGIAFSGYLKVATTSTNDVTVYATATIPDYATT